VVQAPRDVLFLCTGNSARSILAEGMFNHLAAGRSLTVRAHSAGSHPMGRVNPLALQVLRDAGIEGAPFRSKSWDEFAGDDAPRMRLVVTVCDQAASETCPYWPGAPVQVHLGYPDPSHVAGSDLQRVQAFELTRQAIAYRLLQVVQLPFASMTDKELRESMQRIART